MQQTFHIFSQQDLVSSKCDPVDAAILNWLVVHIGTHEIRWVPLSYAQIVAALPILRITNTRVLARRVSRMVKVGLLATKLNSGKTPYISLTLKLCEYVAAHSKVHRNVAVHSKVHRNVAVHSKVHSSGALKSTPQPLKPSGKPVSVPEKASKAPTTPTTTLKRYVSSMKVEEVVEEEVEVSTQNPGIQLLQKYFSQKITSLPLDILKVVNHFISTHSEEQFEALCKWYRKEKQPRLGVNIRLMFKADMVQEFEVCWDTNPQRVATESREAWIKQKLEEQKSEHETIRKLITQQRGAHGR